MKNLCTVLVVCILGLLVLFCYDYQNNNKWGISPLTHPEVVAVEKMIDKTSNNVSDPVKKKIALAIVSNGKFYNVPYKHLVAIAFVESNYRPNMINETGDYGVMQVNWHWWGKRYVQDPKDLLNVYKNVEIACKIIVENRKMGHEQLSSYHSFNKEDQKVYQQKLKLALGRL